MIDPQTAEHIELMASLGDKKSRLSLFGVMNHCVTKGGRMRGKETRYATCVCVKESALICRFAINSIIWLYSLGGVRLLRSNLFQPPIDPQMIAERHEAVAEIISSPELLNGLKTTLARFPDLEQILTLCVQAPGPAAVPNLHQIDVKMDRMVGLRQVLEYLPPLASLLEGAASCLLSRSRDMLSALTARSSLLLQMVQLGTYASSSLP